MQTPSPAPDPTSRLMHRWFVQYNPLPLLSAALVLGGVWLLLRAAAESSSVVGQLGVGLIAEVYAFALIGASAFLFRLGQSRSAVMLAMLAALYQMDLTMQVETSAYLGGLGVAASAAWLGLFALKLGLVARALQLRLSRSTWAVCLMSALGMAASPLLLRFVSAEVGSVVVTLLLAAVALLATHTTRRVFSPHVWDARARRCLALVWVTWAALLLAHALYWAHEHALSLALLPAIPLLATRLVRREELVWLAVGVTIVAVMQVAPAQLGVTALVAASVLLARRVRAPVRVAPLSSWAAHPPYRVQAYADLGGHAAEVLRPATGGAALRLETGALGLTYLGVFLLMAPPHGAGLLPHLVPLDAALALAVVALVWRRRQVLPLSPLLASALHLALGQHWLVLPHGPLQWGLAAVSAGFGLLLLTVGLGWRSRGEAATSSNAGEGADRPYPGPRHATFELPPAEVAPPDAALLAESR